MNKKETNSYLGFQDIFIVKLYCCSLLYFYIFLRLQRKVNGESLWRQSISFVDVHIKFPWEGMEQNVDPFVWERGAKSEGLIYDIRDFKHMLYNKIKIVKK